MNKLLGLATVLACLAGRAAAAPPFNRIHAPNQPTCFVNHQAAAQRAAYLSKFAPGFASPISSTTYKVFVVRVDFSDLSMTKTISQTQTFFSNLQKFYLENSYNLVTVTATVSSGGTGAQGAYRMPKTLSQYANGINSDYTNLVFDAIRVATQTSGASLFNGYDHLMIYHAGQGSETGASTSQQNSVIWSVYLPSNFLPPTNTAPGLRGARVLGSPSVNGTNFPGLTVVPETEFQSVDPLGVICHEYGHQQGLPDLYNTSTGGSAVGSWSLMDAGIYLGSPQGSNPAHLDAWSKQFLGFSSPQTLAVASVANQSLGQAELNRTAFVRMPVYVSDVGGDKEYFLLEYRRKSGANYDGGIPGEGLLIWHVDDSIASDATQLANNTINTNSAHRGLDLVEADSTDPSTNLGDAGDPWPGTSGSLFFQSPKANAYNGKDSGLEVDNVTGVGNPSVTFTMKNPFANPAIVANTSVVATGGDFGYVNPDKGERAFIGMKPSQSGTVSIKVYTLNGNLVRDLSQSVAANSQSVASWDIRNSDGGTVSSGIYVIKVSGAGLDAVKKIAVVK